MTHSVIAKMGVINATLPMGDVARLFSGTARVEDNMNATTGHVVVMKSTTCMDVVLFSFDTITAANRFAEKCNYKRDGESIDFRDYLGNIPQCVLTQLDDKLEYTSQASSLTQTLAARHSKKETENEHDSKALER